MDKMIDRIERWLRGEAPPPPIAQLIGFRLTAIKPGEAIIEFDAGEAHANPMGTLHGGVLCDVADAAMGYGFRGYARRRRIFHNAGTQNQLPEADLEGQIESHRPCRQEGARHRPG